jgi:hypothetical protein
MKTMREINKNDIYGSIKNFPLEVVQRMVELTIKEKHTDIEEALKILRNEPWTGFTWAETDEGTQFWYKVIGSYEWWRFYERYPVNLSSPIRYAVVKECSGGFPEEIAGYLGGVTQLSGKGKSGDVYFAYPSINGFNVGFAIKGSPRYKRIIKDGIEL